MLLLALVGLSAAGPRPPLALRGGGAPESELLDSLNTAKLRLHALEHRLKTSRKDAGATSGKEGKAEGRAPVLADPEVGDRVRVRRDVATPRYEWGSGVDHSSVGRLTWFCGTQCTIDFPRHPGWNGLLAEMERVTPGRGLARVGERVRVRASVSDPAYGWGPVVNHGAVGEVANLGYDLDEADREICVVHFEGHANWTGLLEEMELAEPRPRGDDAKHTHAPSRDPPGSGAAAFSEGGEARARGERPLALRAGWVLGATAMALSAQSHGTNAKEGGDAGTRATTARGVKRGQLLRQLGGAMALLLAFFWTLGALLALGAALLDKPLHRLLDEALETALRLRRGLLRRPHPPLVTPPLATPPLTPLVLGAGLQGLQGRLQERLQGLQGLQGAAPRGMPLGLGGEMPPLLRACLLLPLRMPTVFLSALLLNLLCVRGLVPATLEEVRRGFELGFQQLRGANAAAASAELLARQERLLRTASGYLRAAAGVARAARAAAIAILGLVLLGNYFD